MPERRPQVVLVRHGETEWSASGRHTGTTDVPLTDQGRRQAEALGGCLKDWSFVLVLASPLRRAAETCRLAGLAASMEARDDLREWDYGEYEGRTTADIRTGRPGWSLWMDGVPGGETAERVGRRGASGRRRRCAFRSRPHPARARRTVVGSPSRPRAELRARDRHDQHPGLRAGDFSDHSLEHALPLSTDPRYAWIGPYGGTIPF